MSSFVFRHYVTHEIEARWAVVKGTPRGIKEVSTPDPEALFVADTNTQTIIRFGKGKKGVGYLRIPYLLSTIEEHTRVFLKGEK